MIENDNDKDNIQHTNDISKQEVNIPETRNAALPNNPKINDTDKKKKSIITYNTLILFFSIFIIVLNIYFIMEKDKVIETAKEELTDREKLCI